MAQGSLREAIKAVTSTFASPSIPNTLPEEVQQDIEAFLERSPPSDENDAERLHEELLAVFQKHVRSQPDKHGLFVKVLRSFQPAINGERRLLDWWTLVIRPTIDAIGHKRETIEDAKDFILSMLVYDEEETDDAMEAARTSDSFSKRLMGIYLSRTRIPTGEGEVVSPEDEFIAQDLESVLLSFGRRKPKQLLTSIDALLQSRDHRLQALSLLGSFLRLQPPHLHLVLETSVIENLLNCLFIDTSATVVDMALASLIMFLPQITMALVSIMPKLFLVYARVLCWDFYSNILPERIMNDTDSEKAGGAATFGVVHADTAWESLTNVIDSIETPAPKPDYLFTFVYGLFPLNFTQFVRKPRKYLIAQDYPSADVLDLNQGMIRARTEPQRAIHVLHPNFFSTTVEDELTDNRWLRADPADLVSECLGLCVAVDEVVTEPTPPPTITFPTVSAKSHSHRSATAEPVDEDNSANDDTSPTDHRSSGQHDAALTSVTTESLDEQLQAATPTPLAANLADAAKSSLMSSPRVSRHEDGKEMANSQSAASATTPTHSHRSPHSSFHAQIPAANSPQRASMARSTASGAQVDSSIMLQREIILLKNDLNFERYLKQQHLAHIAQLQRKHMSEVTVESETQNLFNSNRGLKAKLVKSNDLYSQLKKETQTSRSQSKKHEEQISSKLKSYREEEKQWKLDIQALAHERDELNHQCARLLKSVEQATLREQSSKHNVIDHQRELEAMTLLQEELESMKLKVRELEMNDLEHAQIKENYAYLSSELETAKHQIISLSGELARTETAYKQKIAALESKLRSSSPSPVSSGKLHASAQQLIDSALAANTSKLQQMRRSYAALQQKYTNLQRRNLELQARGGEVLPTDTIPDTTTPFIDEAAFTPIGGRIKKKPSMSSIRRDGLNSASGSIRRPQHDFADPSAYADESGSAEDVMPDGPAARSTTDRYRDGVAGRQSRSERSQGIRAGQPVRSVSPSERERLDNEASGNDGRFLHDFHPPPLGQSQVDGASRNASAEDSSSNGAAEPQATPRLGGKAHPSSGKKDKDGNPKPSRMASFRGLRIM